MLERADAGPQEAPDEEARGGGAHVRHAARVVRDGEHREEHRVRRGSARANVRRGAVILEPVRSAHRGGEDRVAVHPLVERLLLEQKRALVRVYFANVFSKLTILNKQTLIK